MGPGETAVFWDFGIGSRELPFPAGCIETGASRGQNLRHSCGAGTEGKGGRGVLVNQSEGWHGTTVGKLPVFLGSEGERDRGGHPAHARRGVAKGGFGGSLGWGGWFVSLKDVRIHEAPRQARKLCAGELCNFPRRKASTWILPAA